MKKIILCASLFALALAGCTKEAVNEGEGEIGKGKSISFLGTIEGSDATRVEIGEYTDGAQSVSLLWTPDDKIVVGAYDAEGNLLQGVKEGWNGEPTYYELSTSSSPRPNLPPQPPISYTMDSTGSHFRKVSPMHIFMRSRGILPPTGTRIRPTSRPLPTR